MILTSLSGKSSISVASATLERVVKYIRANPGKTVVEYAGEILVAPLTINTIIGQFMLGDVAAGKIAISYRGREPLWASYVPNPSMIPCRQSVVKRKKVALPGITDKELRSDYTGLVTQYNDATTRTFSPARRQEARRQFEDRVTHVGSNHQETIDRSSDELGRLQVKVQRLLEAVQLLSTVATNAVVNEAA